jgi:hypothetical protein
LKLFEHAGKRIGGKSELSGVFGGFAGVVVSGQRSLAEGAENGDCQGDEKEGNKRDKQLQQGRMQYVAIDA